MAKSRTDVAFPTTLEAVTAEWLTSALRAGGATDREVSSFSLSPLGEGFGQTGIAGRIALTYAGAGVADAPGPRSLVVKMATPVAARREVAHSLGLYEREVGFYQSMAPQFDMRKPRSYFAAIDDSGKQYVLLLEDFPEHRSGDETIGCSFEDAKLAVVEMARLHGANWGGPIARALPAFPPTDIPRYTRAWDQMVESFGELIPQKVLDAKDAFFAGLPALEAWVYAEPVTVIHGDFKLDNLLFGPPGSPDPIVVLDWQAIRRAKGMYDFAYLISQNMNTDVRRAHEEALLDLYRETLLQYGIHYDAGQCREDYRRAMLFLLSVVVGITGLMVNPHERAKRRKTALIGRVTRALDDWNALALLSLDKT